MLILLPGMLLADGPAEREANKREAEKREAMIHAANKRKDEIREGIEREVRQQAEMRERAEKQERAALTEELEEIRRKLGPGFSIESEEFGIERDRPRPDPDPMLHEMAEQFRHHARRLEELAGDFESRMQYHMADRLREAARRQWEAARILLPPPEEFMPPGPTPEPPMVMGRPHEPEHRHAQPMPGMPPGAMQPMRHGPQPGQPVPVVPFPGSGFRPNSEYHDPIEPGQASNFPNAQSDASSQPGSEGLKLYGLLPLQRVEAEEQKGPQLSPER
ncbi:hypothetical protein GC197_00660 [bacterium]|nr:hypothetical protein [bacterium]